MTLRFIVAAVLIASTAVFMQAHRRQEIFPPRLDLRTFPATMGSWSGTDTAIDKDALEVLGKGEFLLRVYQDQEQPQPYVDLFIAYIGANVPARLLIRRSIACPATGWLRLKITASCCRCRGTRHFR